MNLDLYGIDPSSSSILECSKLYPDLNLKIGTSDCLEYDDNFFDLIIVGFCFYVVDRELIFKSVSEIDRVLKSGSFLSIHDFDPLYPTVSKYRDDKKLMIKTLSFINGKDDVKIVKTTGQIKNLIYQQQQITKKSVK